MKKKAMNRALAVGGVLVVSMAQQVCWGAAQDICSDGVGVEVVGHESSFVKASFTPKCSANVTVSANAVDAMLFTVKSMSKKGRHSFGGTSNDGMVFACETESIAWTPPSAGASNGCR